MRPTFLLLLALVITPVQALGTDRRTPVVQAVERATPSVVTIETTVQSSTPFWFFEPQQGVSQGSGVVIDKAGIILTNAHVVDGALDITVHSEGGKSWPAKLLALERDLDLAVLKVESKGGLPAIALADSGALMLGETAIAIGNPYGLGLTVSTGVVSSTQREIQLEQGLYQTYIQTDAAINPGNSGGALVNINGELIGINTMIRANGEGIGWAIPANRAIKVAQDMLTYGEVLIPWLGCDLRDVSPYRLAGTPLEKGAISVGRVHPGGPAAKAGLMTGDVVYEANGRHIASRSDLNAQLAELTPGAQVTLSFLRSGDTKKVVVRSGKPPEDIADRSLRDVLGINVSPNAGGGVVVTSMAAQGNWSRNQLRVGDVIMAVNGNAVRTPEDLRSVINHAKGRHVDSALFTIARGRYRGHVTLGI